MNAQGLWALFCQTGRPEFYLLYRRARDRDRRQGRERAGKTA